MPLEVIFTECPYCDEPQTIPFPDIVGGRWLASRCPKCERVMWVEMSRIAGVTITHQGLLDRSPAADAGQIQVAGEHAEVHSTVLYETEEDPKS